MIPNTILNLEDVHLFEKHDARIKRFRVHQENCSQLHWILSVLDIRMTCHLEITPTLMER